MKPAILLSPWSRGTDNAKNYPYWQAITNELLITTKLVIQVGVGDEPKLKGCEYKFDLPLVELERLVKDVGNFISIDNFLHHLAYSVGVSGTVLWGPSDPRLFGYSTQNNLLKSREYLRKDQFGYYKDYKWEHKDKGWLTPQEVLNGIRQHSCFKHSDKDTLCECSA